MIGVFTSSWRVALAEPDVLPVRISVGHPKGYGQPLIHELAPFGLLDPALPLEEFRRRYIARLANYGVGSIRARINRIQRGHPDRPLLLCCYEARPEDCHRGLAAAWIQAQGGGRIPEWTPTTVQLSLEER